jgi:hypothetical protein
MLEVAKRPGFADITENFFPDELLENPKLGLILSPITPGTPLCISLEEDELFKVASPYGSIFITPEKSFTRPRFNQTSQILPKQMVRTSSL